MWDWLLSSRLGFSVSFAVSIVGRSLAFTSLGFLMFILRCTCVLSRVPAAQVCGTCMQHAGWPKFISGGM